MYPPPFQPATRYRPARARINLDAIRQNYRLAKSLAPGQQAVAVVKANAYGHGAVRVAAALAPEADAFGVACIEEALELRAAGITQPVLLLEGFFSPAELPVISQHNFWCAVHAQAQIDQLAETALPQPICAWLKMDSGMHRLGIPPAEFQAAYQRLSQLPQVSKVVLMSHFAASDDFTSDATAAQLRCFDKHSLGIEAEVSLANSAATLGHPSARRNWQRPGIMLYGATPFAGTHEQGDKLQAGMSLSSQIIAIHELQPGDAIGYNGTYVCERPTRVGTVAMGYADGYPRSARNGTPVLVKGQRTQLIGRVSMDMLTLDLTDLPNAQVGDEVELWGARLPITEVAPYCDAIPYTLLTGISRRVHLEYEEAEAALEQAS